MKAVSILLLILGAWVSGYYTGKNRVTRQWAIEKEEFSIGLSNLDYKIDQGLREAKRLEAKQLE